MFNLLRIIPFLVILANCASIDNEKLIRPTELISPIPTFHVEHLDVLETKNFTAKEKTRLEKVIIPKLNEVVGSKCFKDFIINRDMNKTNGKTSKEVYEDLASGIIQIRLEMYYSLKSTVGYTYSDTNKIWMNRKFHSGFNECSASSNLAHEGLAHKKGYGHAMRNSSTRPFTVPYSVNAGFKACCVSVEPVKTCKRSWRSLWLIKACK